MFAAAMWVLNFIAGYWLEGRAEAARRRAIDAQDARDELDERVRQVSAPPRVVAAAAPSLLPSDVEEADSFEATHPSIFCPKRRDDGPHERGDRGKCLYCDLPLAEVPVERWWCSACRTNVPSSNGRCAKCGRVPRWR